MSRVALILCGLAAAVAGVWVWANGTLQDGAREASSDTVRHAFLQDLDLSSGDHALLLHPLATGEDMRVVTDVEVLRAAQETAFFTDHPQAELKRTLLSVALLSPPTGPTSHGFVSVVKGKEIVQRFTCFAAFCEGGLETDTPHRRDMAGLLEASQPVEAVFERFAHHDKARAAHFRYLKDPDVVQIDPPDLPAPGTIVYPHRVMLYLPAVLLDTDETGETPVEPFDEAELEARFRAAFTHAYPLVDEYRLGELSVSTYFTPQFGWPIVSDKIEGYLRDEAKALVGLDRLMVIEPRVSIDLHGAMKDALMAPDAFAEMPEFLPQEPASVAERLDAIAEAHLGQPCAGCFQIELPVTTVDDIKVVPVDPVSFSLSYYRIIRP